MKEQDKSELRDKFAAAAIQGVMRSAMHIREHEFEVIARKAYKLADEMLKVRKEHIENN